MKEKLNVVIWEAQRCPGILEIAYCYQDIFPLNRVVMYDIDEETSKPLGEFGKILLKKRLRSLLDYTTDKDIAYEDVDFVLPDPNRWHAMRDKDEKIPLHMGAYWTRPSVRAECLRYSFNDGHD